MQLYLAARGGSAFTADVILERPRGTKITRNRIGALTLHQRASESASKREKVSPWEVKGCPKCAKGNLKGGKMDAK